jgi:hypothetical protein
MTDPTTRGMFPPTAPNTALEYVNACRRRVIASAQTDCDVLTVVRLLHRIPEDGLDVWWAALRQELAAVGIARRVEHDQLLALAMSNVDYLLYEAGLRPDPNTLLAEIDAEPRRADR